MNLPIKSEDILIKTQPTPNPYAVKFIVNQPLKQEGKATFASPHEAENLPLVYDLFLIDGVKQIYLFENTMTITHTGELEIGDLAEQVIAVVRTRLPIHNVNFAAPDSADLTKAKKTDRSHLDPRLQEIEEILDRTIRPGLQADGGDLEVLGLEGNLLRVYYQGACGGCPSSMTGTLDAIEGILRQELNNELLQVSIG